MNARVIYHKETSDLFFARARAYLAEGDLLQASEKGWGAAARMVKAAAGHREWRHTSHRDLYRTVNRLAEELGDDQVRTLFESANDLHQNFYEGKMSTDSVADALHDVEELTARLKAAIR